jgi:hypothetical protein
MTDLTKPFSAEEQAVEDAIDAGDPAELLRILVDHHPKASDREISRMFLDIAQNDERIRKTFVHEASLMYCTDMLERLNDNCREPKDGNEINAGPGR